VSRILLVEDHERLAQLMRKGLSAAGIAADTVHSIESAWAALQQIPYHALLLDRGLPDGDGLVLLQRLRDSRIGIPCIVLTARDALRDRVEGLEAGADDYLPKPFAMDEMVARVRALLRRPAVQRPLEPQAGDLYLRPGAGTLHCAEEFVTLSAAEMQIMQMLMEAGGEAIRRSSLEAAGWGFAEAVTPNALDVALHRLRRKVVAIGSHQRIVNVRNLGYALRASNPTE
jgi:DNA-binding response OmpR family regulator